MNADQVSQHAVENGGASFAVCPVCDEHFPDTGPLMLLEAQLRAHCEAHTAEEYLRVIARLNGRIAELERPAEPTEEQWREAELLAGTAIRPTPWVRVDEPFHAIHWRRP